MAARLRDCSGRLSPTSLASVDERARILLIGAAGCAALFGVILVLAYAFPAARELDAKALEGFLGFQRPVVDGFTGNMTRLGDPPVVGLVGLLLAVIALLRGRPRVAIAVIALLALTSVSSQVLKELLAYPRYPGQIGLARVTPAAFPSGHSTAAMTLAIATVMVVPARLRPLAAVVGGGLALSLGISVVLQGWHFPSDVAGGFLLATGWGLTSVAGLRLAELRWPERTVRGRLATGVRHATEIATGAGLAAIAALGVLTGLAASVLALARVDIGGLVRDHTAALLVGTALLVLALALIAGFVAGVNQREQE
jgi:membrane-associated phospholipid phosphatase